MGALGGHFEITLGTLGWLGVTCGSLWDHLGHMMRIRAGLRGLKIEKVLPTAARSKFLKGQYGHETARESLQLCEPDRFLGHFGITLHRLGLLWDHFGSMRVTMESFWSIFKKHIFFG